MGETRQYQAKTLEVALSKAARDLRVPMEAVQHEVVFDGRRGLFGFGQRDVIIRVDVDSSRSAAAETGIAQERRDGPSSVAEERRQVSPARPHPSAAPPRTGRGPGGARPARPQAREETTQARPAVRPSAAPRTEQGRTLLSISQELIGGMKLDIDCVVHDEGEDALLELSGADERLIIGRHGDVLEALQYLLNRMLARVPGLSGRRVFVDCAGYRSRHERNIEEQARRTAIKVRQTGEAVQMEPMNPYHRRLVHLALQDEPGIKTFSTGEGYLRRLTIAPAD